MPYVWGAVSFIGFLSLVKWAMGLGWNLAIAAGIAWGTAVWGFAALMRDGRFRKSKSALYIIISAFVTNTAANLGVIGAEKLSSEWRVGLATLLLGVGFSGLSLGWLAALRDGQQVEGDTAQDVKDRRM